MDKQILRTAWRHFQLIAIVLPTCPGVDVPLSWLDSNSCESEIKFQASFPYFLDSLTLCPQEGASIRVGSWPLLPPPVPSFPCHILLDAWGKHWTSSGQALGGTSQHLPVHRVVYLHPPDWAALPLGRLRQWEESVVFMREFNSGEFCSINKPIVATHQSFTYWSSIYLW